MLRALVLAVLVSSVAFGADFVGEVGLGVEDGRALPRLDDMDDEEDSSRLILGGKLKLGAGVEFKKTAYKQYDLQWSAAPLVDFENDYFYIRDFGVGGKLINMKDCDGKPLFTLSAFAAYENFKFDNDDTDDAQMKLLDNRRSSVYMGLNAALLTKIGLFEAWAAQDVLGHGDGLYGRVSYTIGFNAGPVAFYPRIGADWANNRYNRYYYGITKKESAKSGLAAYRPGGSISPFAGLAVVVPIGKRWELAGNAEISRVPNTVRDSAMTDRKTTHVFGGLLNYKF